MTMEMSPPVADVEMEQTGVPFLSVRSLSVTFAVNGRSLRAVRGIDLSVRRGGTLSILGESGSGKSVTLGAILGTLASNSTKSGSVHFDGQELLSLSEPKIRALRGAQIGFVPQSPNDVFDPLRRIGSQIVECIRVHKVCRSRSAARSRAVDLLRQVGIPDPAIAARSYPHELSGGMCQRAAIAMAISCDPVLLLADEPTTALDVSVQAQILDLFRGLQRERDMALVMVTHDVGVAEELGGDVAVVYSGRVVEQGSTQAVLASPVHPYTAGLLRSRPSREIARGELIPIPGQPPSLLEEAAGCAFAPRCDAAVASCVRSIPHLESWSEPGLRSATRAVACPPRLEVIAGGSS